MQKSVHAAARMKEKNNLALNCRFIKLCCFSVIVVVVPTMPTPRGNIFFQNILFCTNNERVVCNQYYTCTLHF